MSKKFEKQGWHDFLLLCSKAKSLEELDALFNFFFTIEEKESLTTRYLIVQALLRGEDSQREIAQNLKVSISKITRGSNALKTISSQLKSFLKKEME